MSTTKTVFCLLSNTHISFHYSYVSYYLSLAQCEIVVCLSLQYIGEQYLFYVLGFIVLIREI